MGLENTASLGSAGFSVGGPVGGAIGAGIGAVADIFGGNQAQSAARMQEQKLWEGLRSIQENNANARNSLGNARTGSLGYWNQFNPLTTSTLNALQNEVNNPTGMNSTYDYMAQRGVNTLSNQLAARGLSQSGNAGQQIGDYLANLGSQTYGQRIGLLQNLGQLGYNVTGQQSNIEQNYGTNMSNLFGSLGQDTASLYGAIGQSRAAGTTGQAAGMMGAINQMRSFTPQNGASVNPQNGAGH